MIRMALLALWLAGASGALSGARAQAADRPPSVLSLPAGTRAVALGGAFPLAEASSDALFLQPGILDEAAGLRLGVQRWSDRSTLVDLSAAREWWSGGVAAGVRVLSSPAPAGDPLPALAEHELFQPGENDVSSLAASVGYARSLDELHLGAAVKWVVQRREGDEATTVAGDVGLALSVGEGARVGLAVQNLGPGLERRGIGRELPRRFRIDASVAERPVGPLDVGGAATVVRRADGEIVPGAGLEVEWWPVQGRTFIGRIGLRRVAEGPGSPLSLGAAFEGDSAVLEYAYRSFGDRGATHRIGLGWR